MFRRRFVRRLFQILVDLGICAGAFVAAYLVRFEGATPSSMFEQMTTLGPYVVAIRILSIWIAGVYRIEWRYISLRDVQNFLLAAIPPTALIVGARLSLPEGLHPLKIPLGITALEFMFVLAGLLSARVTRRALFERVQAYGRDAAGAQPVLLIGGGRAGGIVAREIKDRADIGLKIVGFLDDDGLKRGQTIQGVTVLGTTAELPELVKSHKIAQVIITIANARSADIRRIVALCESANVRAQIVPSIHELVEGTVSVSRIRNVEVEDLLGREPVNLDTEAIGAVLCGRHIMVTGAGGSIGAEMCRQVCRFTPGCLVLIDHSENSLFEIERELRAKHPDLAIMARIADICDQTRMAAIFSATQPHVVIHAAAHKHVPMMEANPGEAVKNNFFGTRVLADLAFEHGVSSFVLISTDKAVNPVSVMGATKRLAEVYVQWLSERSRTRFITVRFGNVLGSVGSVVPIFKAQIARGGPVTVTDREMERYFMTIPEASQLVLQAASMGQGGEIYVLDMGEPMKIVTLAEELIRTSCLKPYEDIDIVFTGIRPGEKLFEEMALDGEGLAKTSHSKIYVGRFRPFVDEEVQSMIATLRELVGSSDAAQTKKAVMDTVATVDLKSGSSWRAAASS